MRYVVIFFVVAVVLWSGNFAYTLWIRPIDQPTPELVKLKEHFEDHRVLGRIYPVRHTFSHSKVLAVAAFEIKDYPLPFGLTAYATEDEAIRNAVPRPNLPLQLQPVRNGKIVLDFTFWGDDTIHVAQTVTTVFSSFAGKP